jgi:hypothetical protein
MAGRPKKIQEETIETKKEKTTTPKKITEDIKKENEDLKNEIEKLKMMMESLLSNSNIQKNVIAENIEQPQTIVQEEVFEDVRPDKQIPVMSLENNAMYLTTLPKGQGKQFPFYKFHLLDSLFEPYKCRKHCQIAQSPILVNLL